MYKILRSFLILLGLTLVSGRFFVSCNQPSSEGMLIITQIEKNQKATEFPLASPIEARLMMIDPEAPEKKALLLTKEFYSA